MSEPAAAPSVQHLLGEEVARLRDFLVLLEQEQQALMAGDIEQLLPLAAEKTTRFTELGRLGELRAQALAAAGYANDRPGMTRWLAQQSDAAPRRDWQALLTLAEKASHLNRTNGQLISSRLASNQQALATLMAAADQASLYGPDGQSRAPGSGRSLGSV